MAEIEPDVARPLGFKVRPLSRVAKADPSLAEPKKSEIRDQRSEASSSTPDARGSRLRELTEELRALEAKLRLGGGRDKIEKQHKAHKLTARERIDLLLDKDSYRQEIGLLVAYDQYDGKAPAVGVVTTIGRVNGREVVVVANDATV